jgi:hypothetical protein
VYQWAFVVLLSLSGTSLAQSLPPPIPVAPDASAATNTPAAPTNQAPAATPAERSLTDRAGAAVGKAAEETTSAFGRAMNWTGRQL